jgi:hypothetical protein
MQWACDNIPCECTVDITYTLDGNALRASVVLNNDRSDVNDYGSYSQEVPAVYTNGFLDRLVGYAGGAPCADPRDTGALSTWDPGWDDTPGVWPWLPGHVSVTEPWMALLQEARVGDFGVGVYSGAPEVSPDGGASFSFDAGFAGEKGSGGTGDSPTGYMAPIATTDLPGKGAWAYGFALILGNVGDIRTKACELWLSDLKQQAPLTQPPAKPHSKAPKAFTFEAANGKTTHVAIAGDQSSSVKQA